VLGGLIGNRLFDLDFLRCTETDDLKRAIAAYNTLAAR
jgi:hypothetical protein